MTRSPAEMAEEIEKLAWSKRTWLSDFADGRNKRPDHEITVKRLELEVLEQAARDYRRAAERAA